MFKNKHIDGKCNRCGEQIAKLRKQLPDKTSQRILADRMQEKGIDMDKNAIQRIEHGDRRKSSAPSRIWTPPSVVQSTPLKRMTSLITSK